MGGLFSGDRAYEHLRVLCEEIGPRHGGSRSEAKAARYIRDVFKGLGLRTRLERYPIYGFEDAKASLLTPRGKSIDCIPLPMTTPTPVGGLTKPCVFLEGPDAVCLDERVRGKIVVMLGTFSGALLKQFHAYKPAGLVSIQTVPHTLASRTTYKADVKRKVGSIPTVILTLETGMALVRALPKVLTMNVSTQDERVTTGYNVVADLKGSGTDEDVVVMCAHYDSVWGSAGAVDNGGGASALMELARVYKQKGSIRNLRFIAFGGEETGIWGARGYVKKLKDEDEHLKKDHNFERDGLTTELDRIRFLINLDMMGPLHGRSSAFTLGHPDIAASARLLANELRYALDVNENSIYSSDNMAFNCASIPSISFNRCGYEDFGAHTVRDTIENCSAEGLAHIGAMVEAWVDRHVIVPHVFPFSRALPEVATKTMKAWFKDGNPLDYEVSAPTRQYKPKRKAKPRARKATK
jgi:hypothetical protein